MIRAIVEMKLTLERHLVMRIKDQINCREMKLTERNLVMRIKDKSSCREMKLTLEIHLVMRIKDKSNCRDEVNARKTSGHAY